MTFNIRYGTAKDGENRWELRRGLTFETIRAANADLMGLQEVLSGQADELREAFPEYEFVGVGRDDGERRGEFAPILFRRSVFTLIDSGFFWLSDEPERPGSVGWDAALTRMATWVKLRHRVNPLSEVFMLNTHFDHRGERARLESARLIRRMVESLGDGPLIITGDFNCAPGSAPYLELMTPRAGLTPLFDAYAWLRTPAMGEATSSSGQPSESEGTYHSFRGETTRGRIDWLLHNRRYTPLHVEIDRRNFDGRYPSDHFPVVGVLKLVPILGWGT